MRIILVVALFLFSGLCSADEWDQALHLESWEEAQSYWSIARHFQTDEISGPPKINEPLQLKLESLIKKDGVPLARVVQSSGNPDYDQFAVEIHNTLRFRPTEENDPPRAVVFPVKFATQGNGE